MPSIILQGKIIITGEIEALTGLHIGGAAAGLDIGGVDNPVLRHPLTREPYVPGSSLRGKMRCLMDRHLGTALNKHIGQATIHECNDAHSYATCVVCKIFGLPGERNFAEPARLLVRDVLLTRASTEALRAIKTGLPFTEIKTEVAIDRITSAANPRQNERVPAGAIFGPLEMVYSLYAVNGNGAHADLDRLPQVFKAMELLEDDYLGGYGSRGAGKVRFRNLSVTFKPRGYYDGEAEIVTLGENLTVAALRAVDYRAQIEAAMG
jgi:CRISPR-associated protein Csm3